MPVQAMPGRAPSPVPRRPGSAERWEHDGAAAGAAAAAARIVPAKPSGNSRQRDQQVGAAPPSSATAQQAQTAVQKAAAAVPDRVAMAGTDSPSARDGSARNAHPVRQENDSNGAVVGGSGREVQGSRLEKQQVGRHSERQSHTESLSGEGDDVARGRRSASPVQQQQHQKSSRGEAVAGPGSRWLLLLWLCSSFVISMQQAWCSCLGSQVQTTAMVADLWHQGPSEFVDNGLCCNFPVKLCTSAMLGGDQAPQGVWWDHRRQLAHAESVGPRKGLPIGTPHSHAISQLLLCPNPEHSAKPPAGRSHVLLLLPVMPFVDSCLRVCVLNLVCAVNAAVRAQISCRCDRRRRGAAGACKGCSAAAAAGASHHCVHAA